MSSKIVFILLSIFSFFNKSYANEELSSFWLQHLPYAASFASEMENADVKLFATSDQAMFSFENAERVTQVACHVHLDTGVCHCSLAWLDAVVPRDYNLIFDLSSQKINELLTQMDLTQVSAGDPVWPWVLGAVAGYYAAKKVINLWLHKNFKAQPHTHEFSVLERGERKDQVEDLQKTMDRQQKALDEIFNENLEINVFERARLQALLESRIANLTRQVITDLTSTYCHSCKTFHSPAMSHSPAPFKFSGLGSSAPVADFTAHELQQLREKMTEALTSVGNSNSFPRGDSDENKIENAQEIVKSGTIVRVTKALLSDIYKELIEPFPKMAKSLRKMATTSGSVKQIGSYVQTKYHTAVGESNLVTASAVVVSLITIKVVGETVETLVFGPYHVLCQISDVAALTVGLTFLTVYHTLRQPLRQKKIGYLFQTRFWRSMWDRLSTPTLNSRIQALERSDTQNPVEILMVEIERLKSNIQQILWQLRALDVLSPQALKMYARKLGEISKSKEDTLFENRMKDSYDPQDLLKTIDFIKPIFVSYQGLYKDLQSDFREPALPSRMCRDIFG